MTDMPTCHFESWEALCDAGRLAADDLDTGRWRIGDLAMLVERSYGANAIGKYAIEINIEKRRVYEMCALAHFYPPETRYLFPNLRYSHYRDAARLGDLERSLEFLTQSSDEGLTVEQARLRLLGKTKPDKVKFEIIPVGVQIYPREAAQVVIMMDSTDVERLNDFLRSGGQFIALTLTGIEKSFARQAPHEAK